MWNSSLPFVLPENYFPTPREHIKIISDNARDAAKKKLPGNFSPISSPSLRLFFQPNTWQTVRKQRGIVNVIYERFYSFEMFLGFSVLYQMAAWGCFPRFLLKNSRDERIREKQKYLQNFSDKTISVIEYFMS